MLSRVVDNISCYNLGNENILREVTVKIGLEKIDICYDMIKCGQTLIRYR